jgi:hypothetical protein
VVGSHRIGLADKMVTRVVTEHTGVPWTRCGVILRETGDVEAFTGLLG